MSRYRVPKICIARSWSPGAWALESSRNWSRVDATCFEFWEWARRASDSTDGGSPAVKGLTKNPGPGDAPAPK